jgi:glutamine amidotransferase
VRLSVIDLGTSNMRSLTSALAYLGAPYTVTTTADDVAGATHVILPGVGAYDAAMSSMHRLGLYDALREHGARRPLLGVCLGMQLLFEGSDEGEHAGLGLVPGRFHRLAPPAESDGKVPHVGFARVSGFAGAPLYAGFGPEAYFYFTHSYALTTPPPADAVGVCEYAQPFVATFQRGHLCGAQFHPEKSQSSGLRLLSNFLDLR